MSAKIDMTGKRIGEWTIVGWCGTDGGGNSLWKCLCSCGKEGVVTGNNLRRNKSLSCGCKLGENISKGVKGNKHPFWKGGRIKHKGYIKIPHKTHPRADAHGYIFEHIAVAERLLGEYIPVGQVIHHINGIKDDNRPENLMWFPSDNEHRKYHLGRGVNDNAIAHR